MRENIVNMRKVHRRENEAFGESCNCFEKPVVHIFESCDGPNLHQSYYIYNRPKVFSVSVNIQYFNSPSPF